MSKNINLDLKSLLPKIKKFELKASKHIPFVAIVAALLVYIFVVWQIRGLVNAEPTQDAEDQALTSTKIPKIDQKAIEQIQSLENNSPEIHSLFNSARNNPFNE
ncbi:MAG TPA: hypothetical protein VFB03_00995 [Candidatus Saccharimonadales bacterium]|nr:hypothetical protein [Candidatus Saccharimonadales bacterium]